MDNCSSTNNLQNTRLNALLKWLQSYSQRFINPCLAEERRGFPPSLFLDLGNQGLFGLHAPSRFEGLNLPYLDSCKVYQQLGAIDIGLARSILNHNEKAVRPLHLFGNEALQEKFLDKLARGRLLADSINLTQKVSHESQLNGWLLNGSCDEYIFHWAKCFTIFAASNEAMEKAHCYLLDYPHEGLTQGPPLPTFGERSFPKSFLSFKNTVVSEENRLGAKGQGKEILDIVLLHSRLACSFILLGASKKALQIVFGRLNEQGDTYIPLLAKASVDLKILENLLWDTSKTISENPTASLHLAMALKALSSKMAIETIQTCLTLAGWQGHLETSHLPRLMRGALASAWWEGRNEILLSQVDPKLYKTLLEIKKSEVKLDETFLSEQIETYRSEIGEIQFEMAGEDFNIDN